MNPAYCIGAYGFQVSADGSFAAGPDPGGKTVTGQITPPELQTLNGDVAQLTQADLNASLVCQGSHIIPGVMDEVTLQNGSQTYTLYEGNSVSLHGSDCVSGDPAKEERLHSDLNAIMKEYYPVPFPSGNIPGPTPTASP